MKKVIISLMVTLFCGCQLNILVETREWEFVKELPLSDMAGSESLSYLYFTILTGGIFVSTDYGATSECNLDHIYSVPGEDGWVSVCSSRDGRIAAAENYHADSWQLEGGDYVYITTNYGQDWEAKPSSGFRYWTDIACSSDGTTFYATTNSGRYDMGKAFVSDNGGESWSILIDADLPWAQVCCTADASMVLLYDKKWATRLGHVYLVDINNDKKATKLVELGMRNWVEVDCSADGTIIFAVDGGSDLVPGYVYASYDRGVSWSKLYSLGRNKWISLSCSDDGQTVLVVPDEGYVYSSADGGLTWFEEQGIGLQKNWRCVFVSSSGSDFVVSKDRAIWRYRQ